MNNLIVIIAGEPDSINSEIIAKAWRNKRKLKNILIVGNHSVLKRQIFELGIKIPIVKIDRIKNFKRQEKLFVLDVPINFKSTLKINSYEVKNYIFKCFDIAHDLAVKKKIIGFINAPVDKKIFNNKFLGVTEYLSKKNKCKNNEVMLIYNKKLAVVPLTTHIKIKEVTKKINFKLIKTKIINLNKFYFKLFKKKPRIAILGLNPHNSESKSKWRQCQRIKPAIIKLNKLKVNIKGPFPADTAFNKKNAAAYDVIVGMYHDQVLAPFKALYGYDAINITLGLKYLRLSPDHGTAHDIIGLNKASPQSLINTINFLNKIND